MTQAKRIIILSTVDSSKYFRAISRFKEIKGGQDHYRKTNHKRIH